MRPPSPTAALASSATGQRIREARRAAGLSQIQLARRVGVGRRTVQAWEAGSSGISLEHLQALGVALGFDPEELAGTPAAVVLVDAAQLARVEAKLDALLSALGLAAAGAARAGDVIDAPDGWALSVVSRFAEGFAEVAPLLANGATERQPGESRSSP